jgi:RecA-family ATPase
MHHTSDRPTLIEIIRSETQDYSQRAKKASRQSAVPDSEPGKNMFQIYSANHWLELEKDTPAPKMLFGEFWYEGELCILFADTNAGKSVLAVQIGNSLACNEKIGSFAIETEQANVVYIDFELSGKQFQSRYTHNDVTYRFGKSFYRAGFNPAADMPYDFKNYDDYMNSAIEYVVKRTGADVLIIDNITCLRRGTEHAADALPLMKHLKALKTKHQLSILVLAHTPKRNPSKPITRNDLQGSKMLINFADSAFAIGESHQEKGLRYLKQVKQRNTNEVYGAENVCLCHIIKPQNYLKYEFLGHAHERAHLHRPSQHEKQLLAAQVTELSSHGLSQRQISTKLGIGLATVNRVLNEGGG